MVDFRSMFITWLLIGVFIIALISGGALLADNNNINQTILNINSGINSTFNTTVVDLTDKLESTEEDVNTFRESFSDDAKNPVVSGIFLIPSMAGIVLDSISIIIIIFNLIFNLITNYVSPVIIVILTSVFVFTMILLIWRVLKTGS